MSTHQAKLLLQLAAKIKSQPKQRSEIVASLKAAGIIDKAEKLTAHYSNLNKVVATVE